jgi:hypothetical protein
MNKDVPKLGDTVLGGELCTLEGSQVCGSSIGLISRAPDDKLVVSDIRRDILNPFCSSSGEPDIRGMLFIMGCCEFW